MVFVVVVLVLFANSCSVCVLICGSLDIETSTSFIFVINFLNAKSNTFPGINNSS